MKYLLACLTVIVYMNFGKVYTYPFGYWCNTTGGNNSLFGASAPDTTLQVWHHFAENDGKFEIHNKLLASFNLRPVERWEVK